MGFGCSELLRCDREGSRAAGGHGERVPLRGPSAPVGHWDSNGALAASGGCRGLSSCWETPPPKKRCTLRALHSTPSVSGPGSAPWDGAERSYSELLPPASAPQLIRFLSSCLVYPQFLFCFVLFAFSFRRSGSRTGEPSAESRRTRCTKVGRGQTGGRWGACRVPSTLTGPVCARRCDLGHRQPLRRLQSGPVRQYGSLEDAFPTGSSPALTACPPNPSPHSQALCMGGGHV